MNKLITLEFGMNDVETIIKNKETFFVAKDVCKILEIKNVTQALQILDEDEKLTYVINRAGQNRELNFVNEFGLYNLILKSRKPEAKKFKRWITHEVIPSIRKYGSYPKPVLTQEISNEVLKLKEVGAELMVSSKDLADMFSKYHITIMKDIVNVFNCFKENKDDFEKAYYIENGYKKIMYYINKDGFDILTLKYCNNSKHSKLRQYYMEAFKNYELNR